jgi:gluconolactonase
VAAGQRWKFCGRKGQQRRRDRWQQRWRVAHRAERQQPSHQARWQRPAVYLVHGYADGRIVIDQLERRTLHRAACAAHAIAQLTPRKRILAQTYQGDPLDCAGLNPNDLTADGKGGVYFTQGGVYYANPRGVVSKYGSNITPNGIILSRDEKTLYVTNGPVLDAFDVQPDGSLTNQRVFARLEGGGNGDGSTIDAEGRIYVTTNPGVQVIAADGTYLGLIPTPRPVISAAFGGAGKKTLFVLARGARDAAGGEIADAAQVYAIDMSASGYRGRAK